MQIYALTTVTHDSTFSEVVTRDEVRERFMSLTEPNEADRQMESEEPTDWYMESPSYQVYVSDPYISPTAAHAITKTLPLAQKIKEWYYSAYPEDAMGEEMCGVATFKGLNANLPNVYAYIGVTDSLMRERLFIELSDRLGVPYSDVYDRWSNNIGR